MHVSHTNGTVLLDLLRDTLVVVFHAHGQTAPTDVAVEEVLPATNTTYPTAFAVEDLLPNVVIIKQVTDGAEVAGKLKAALLAVLLWLLNMLAFVTLDSSNLVTIHLVVLLKVQLLFEVNHIVTETAGPELLASRTLLETAAFVVLTIHEVLLLWLLLNHFFILSFTRFRAVIRLNITALGRFKLFVIVAVLFLILI